jgi:hypothetical protein
LKSAKEAVSALRMNEAPDPYGTTPPDIVTEAGLGAGLNRRVADALGILAAQSRTNRRLQALLISLAEYSCEE